MNTAFIWPVRVYYEDTDAGGVVYYANYLRFYERARTEYLRQLGYQQDRLIEQQQIIFVVRSVQVDYKKPALFNQLLEVSAEVSDIKPVRLVFEQSIHCDDQLLSTAKVTIACVDSETMRPKKIPENLLSQFTS